MGDRKVWSPGGGSRGFWDVDKSGYTTSKMQSAKRVFLRSEHAQRRGLRVLNMLDASSRVGDQWRHRSTSWTRRLQARTGRVSDRG